MQNDLRIFIVLSWDYWRSDML